MVQVLDRAPLSFSQERLWFLNQLSPASAAYNIVLAIDLAGPLDVRAFRGALEAVVRRHESLRTIFPAERGVPYQVVEPPGRFTVPFRDLTGVDPVQREAAADAVIDEQARLPFDLAAGPVFRAQILRLTETRHVLVAVVHHIVYDAWSNGIVLRELATCYQALLTGEPIEAEPPASRFIDFAIAQRERLQGAVLERELTYWKSLLANPPHLALLTDRRPPIAPSHEGARVNVYVPGELIEAVESFSRREGVTLFVTLLSAYATLLLLNTGQDAMVIGTPIANRSKREHEPIVGFFLNTLALVLDLSGRPTFRELVQRVKKVAFGAYAHQDLPFDKLIHELHPERVVGRTPLIDTMFVLDNSPGAVASDIRIGDLSMSRRVIDNGTAKFDLFLGIFRRDAGRRVIVEFRRELFEAATARRLLDHYQRILKEVRDRPDAPIHHMLRPTADEVPDLVSSWNRAATPYPRDRSLDQLVEAEARAHGEAPAVVEGDRTISYAELNRRANQLAHHLRRSGVRSNSRVALCLPRSADTIVTLLAIVKAGAAYVPLDSTYPPERLRVMIRRGGAGTIVTTKALAGSLPAEDCSLVLLDEDGPAIDREPDGDLALDNGPRTLAYVLFTSGTTGDPKPVGVTHRPIIRLASGMPDIPFGAGHRMLFLAPLTFDLSVLEIWAPLLCGGTVVVSPSDLPTPAELERVLTSHDITVLWLTASLFNLVIDERPTALRTVRHVIAGGEALSVPHIERAMAALPHTTLVNGYGPTETTTFATYHVIRPGDVGRPSIPIGRALENTRVYVLDEDLHPVLPGIPGELWIGGDAVAEGYLDDPDLTAARFLPDPFSGEGARMYRSGDRVRVLDDGLLEYLGRTDDQVKIRGVRIEPAEIEHALTAHPAVERAAVIAHDIPGAGLTLVAYVVCRRDRTVDAAGLKAFLRTTLPERLVPPYYELLSALPLKPNGKIDRRALTPPTIGPAKDHNRSAPGLSGRTWSPVEQAIADVWQPLLRARTVALDSDFFELGGDSLLAAQAVSRLAVATGVELSVRSLFEFSTVAGLAKVVEEHLAQAAGDVTTTSLGEPRPTVQVVGSDGLSNRDDVARGVSQRAGEIETTVAEVWRSVLGVASIDPDDNFFALGGHSLMAVRVMGELESRLGVSIAPATLFEHGSLRAQCRLIREHGGQINASPLVTIQPSGSKPALFLVHAIGGEILSYEPLAARLGHERPLYGLRVETRNGLPVHASVEHMAASYVNAMRRAHPRGPYLLAGYSGGGLIAYEMAQQLRRDGADISLLALIDCHAPSRPKSGFSTWHWLCSPWTLFRWVQDDDFFRDGVGPAVARARGFLRKRRYRAWAGEFSPDLDARDALGLWRYPDSSRDYLTAMYKLVRGYRPQPYGGDVSVFRARSKRPVSSRAPEPDAGWHRFVAGDIRVEVVPGAHDTILREPRVGALAEAIKRASG